MKSMPASKVPGLENKISLALPWLVGLRWAAMVSQALLILLVVFFFDIPVPPIVVSVIFGFSWLSNMYLHTKQESDNTVTNGLVTAVFIIDTIMLTLLIYTTGGALNPFTFLYIIPVILAAIILPKLDSWLVTLITILCYGALFLPGVDSIGGLTNHPPAANLLNDMTGALRLHLWGMWVAYSLTAVFVVFLVGKIQNAIGFGQLSGEAQQSFLLAEAVSGILESIHPTHWDRVQVHNNVPDDIVFLPQDALCQTVAELVNKTLKADSTGGMVNLDFSCEGKDLVVNVTSPSQVTPATLRMTMEDGS